MKISNHKSKSNHIRVKCVTHLRNWIGVMKVFLLALTLLLIPFLSCCYSCLLHGTCKDQALLKTNC